MLHLKEFALFYGLQQTNAALKMYQITPTILFQYYIDLLNNLKKVQFYRSLNYFARSLVQREGLSKIMDAI